MSYDDRYRARKANDKPTTEERIRRLERLVIKQAARTDRLERAAHFDVPEQKYVKVVLDESTTRESVFVKPYTYEDRTTQGLKVGDRVVVPVGLYSTDKDATVIQTDVTPKGNYTIKVVSGVL